MSRTTVASKVSARTTEFVAKHPRLVVTMALFVLLIAVQGGAVAETAGFGDFSTSGAGSVDDGP